MSTWESNSAWGNAEERRRLFVAAGLAQGGLGEDPHRQGDGRNLRVIGGLEETLRGPLEDGALALAAARLVEGQVARENDIAAREDAGALDEIFQLAHVAGQW